MLWRLAFLAGIASVTAKEDECEYSTEDGSLACASKPFETAAPQVDEMSSLRENSLVLVHDILERAFADISKLEQLDAGSSGTVWGTLTLTALDNVYSWLNVSADDVFCDLGSGIGKPVLHAALQSPPPSSVLGIEIGETRHQAAMKALARVEELLAEAGLPPLSSRPVFKLLDLRELPQEELLQCTRVFLNNAGYPKETLSYLADVLEQQSVQRGDRAIRPRRIMSLMTLPGWGPASRQGKGIKELFYNVVDASWGPVPVHIYEIDK